MESLPTDGSGVVMKPAKKVFFGSLLILALFFGPMWLIQAWIVPIEVWGVGDGVKVSPAQSPQESNAVWSKKQRTFSVQGARNEFVAFQVILNSGSDTPEVSVQVSDLGMGEQSISRGHVELFREHYLNVTSIPDEKWVTLGPGEYPDPLIPFVDPETGRAVGAPFDLIAGRNQPIWVDLYIPPDAQAGEYQGTISILSGGSVIKKLKLRLNVWDFTLPDKQHLNGWVQLYLTRFLKGENLVVGNETFRQMLNQYIVMGQRHRFDFNDGWDLRPRVKWNVETGEILKIDWTEYDRIYGPVLDGSLTGTPPRVWCLPVREWWGLQGEFGFSIQDQSPLRVFGEASTRAIEAYTREITAHFEEKGWPLENTFIYVFDEPTHKLYYPEIYLVISKYAEAVQRASGGKIRFLITDAPYVWDFKQSNKHKEQLTDHVDIWASSAKTYIPSIAQKHQARGRDFWFYQAQPPFVGGSGINYDGLALRSWPWIAWKYRVDGIFLWAGNFWNEDPYRNPRNWNNHIQGNGVMFYPGNQLHSIGIPDIRGPVSSFRMKAWRRGMQDYEYMWLLKQIGKEKEADRIVDSVVPSALNHGGNIPYWEDPLWAQPGSWSHDPDGWTEAREKLAREILGEVSEKTVRHGVEEPFITTPATPSGRPGELNQKIEDPVSGE